MAGAGSPVHYCLTFFVDKESEENGDSYLMYYCCSPHIPLEEQTLRENWTLFGIAETLKAPATPSMCAAPPPPHAP